MARKRDRVFALVMAVLFFVTAFGFSFLVIWQLHNNGNSSNSSQSTQQVDKLQGTKLPGFTPVSSVSKLEVSDTKPGTGTAVTSASQTISVIYTGAVASSGIIFQSNSDTGQVLTDQLNQLLPGWQQGLIGMKVGGSRQILIPPDLAYGANPPPGSGIPVNAPLVFDVTLLNVSGK